MTKRHTNVPVPRGARDLLPGAAARRRALVEGLGRTFEAWGYGHVITPAVEYFDVMARGLSEEQRARSVRFIEPGSGDLVALRADITPQIARMVASRTGGELPQDVPVRLSYAADVVHQPDGRRGQTELHQVGVELIGDGSPAADAELIALVYEALTAVGLADMRIDLAHTAVARGVLAEVGVNDESVVHELHGLLARKDANGARALLERSGVPETTGKAVVALCDLFGPPEVLDRARRVLACKPVVAALDRLGTVLETLQAVSPEAHARVGVDLGEVRGFDYYTGLRLRVWAPGASEPVARGGRYNDLLGRYGAGRPATGVAFDLDALEAALAHAGALPDAAPAPAWIVVTAADTESVRRQASLAARTARVAGFRSWVCPGIGRARGQEVAADAGADRLTVIEDSTSHFELRDGAWIPLEENQT